ncbi:unnamed protein product [Cyprideis torosa]|uniref:Uncharacterized protein n=1 Tax=Cyprideis torosa TaxID=163714 RepID=A0A7R8W3R4_9CRUS|nr:unnamed protein product [Cyprideis torosa]CAG0879913.1 unnamed protein product [Cyprideis torosa]
MVTMSVDERRESCASVDSISSTGSNTCHAPKFGTRIKNRVFIGGLPPQTSDKELSAFFSDYGTIKDCKIINDRAGISRGYGFLTFDSEEVASNVVADASKEPKIFKERRLNIAPAVRKNEPFRPAPPPFHFSPGGYPPPPPGGSPYPHPHHHPHPSLSYPYPSPFGYPAPSPPAYYPHPPNGSIPEFHYYNPSPQAMPHPPGAGTPNTASSVPCSSHVFYGPSTGPIYVHPSPYALGGWPPGPGSYRPWTPSSGSQGDQLLLTSPIASTMGETNSPPHSSILSPTAVSFVPRYLLTAQEFCPTSQSS